MPAAIDVNLKSLDKAIQRMERAGRDARPAWRKLRTPMRVDQRTHMKRQQGPSGPWRPLAPSTVARRMRVGGRAGKFTKRGKLKKSAQRKLNRILSARLLTKAKIRIFPAGIKMTSQVEWAGVHQKGGRVGRNSRVPARVFMWISDPLARTGARIVALHLSAAWEKKKL